MNGDSGLAIAWLCQVTQLLVGGEEDEVSEAEAQRLRLQMIKRGQIRVQVYLEEGVVKVLIGEAQGLRVNIRGLPSPFAKCHYEHDSIDKVYLCGWRVCLHAYVRVHTKCPNRHVCSTRLNRLI